MIKTNRIPRLRDLPCSRNHRPGHLSGNSGGSDRLLPSNRGSDPACPRMTGWFAGPLCSPPFRNPKKSLKFLVLHFS